MKQGGQAGDENGARGERGASWVPLRISQTASLALVAALGVALAGLWLQRSGQAVFLGGVLLAFGEAALVGGMADWFAVRALFAHPLGLPFPHTALIPRSRERIIREIGDLVENEWLPRSLLLGKLETFDFVGQALDPVVEPMRPYLRDLLRSVGQDLVQRLSPEEAADLLGQGLARSLTPETTGPLLAGLVRRAAENRWLEPLVRQLMERLAGWAKSRECYQEIHSRLEHAAETYQEHSFFRSLTYGLANLVGGVDLDRGAAVLQGELRRFAEDQLGPDSPVEATLRRGLRDIEERLRDDPGFLADLRTFLGETSQGGKLPGLLTPVLRSLRQVGQEDLEREDSRLLGWAVIPLDHWLARVREDQELRQQVNHWCRSVGRQLLERHHSLVGKLVQEQLNRLSEQHLTDLIQARVGEDLAWIRLNGTFVGGLIGVLLYLLFHLVAVPPG